MGVGWMVERSGCQKDNILATAGEQVGLHADTLTEPGSVREQIKQKANRWDVRENELLGPTAQMYSSQ